MKMKKLKKKPNKNNMELENNYARLISNLLSRNNIESWEDGERRNLPIELTNTIPLWNKALAQ